MIDVVSYIEDRQRQGALDEADLTWAELWIRGELDPPGVWMGWREWLALHFPHVCTYPFAARHERLWEWFDALEPGVRPLAQVEVWPRGGAKSSTGELGTAWVGMKLSRMFALIVSGTQDQADLHVQSISALFERIGVERAVNKYGVARGWRRDQLRTGNGFNVAGYGLDAAVRGIKLDQYRPDLIIFDDIDSLDDTPDAVTKKIRAITKSIIPAGSVDCAILFLQNLIHEHGIVSQLVDGRADFLHQRSVPPIERAVEGLQTRYVTGEDGASRYAVTGGTATWEGQDLDTCEAQINDWGLEAFLQEAQHEVQNAEGVFFKEWNPALHIVDPPCRISEETNEWGIPHWWPRVGGGDWGYNHPFTAYAGAVSPEGEVYFYWELWLRGRHTDGPDGQAAHLKAFEDFHKVTQWGFGPDIFSMQTKTEGGPTIAELFMTEGVTVTNPLKGQIRRHGWANFRRYLQWRDAHGNVLPGRPLFKIIRGTCPRLIQALPKMLYSRTDPEDMMKQDINPKTGEGGDDAVDGANHTLMTRPYVGREPAKQPPHPMSATGVMYDRLKRQQAERLSRLDG